MAALPLMIVLCKDPHRFSLLSRVLSRYYRICRVEHSEHLANTLDQRSDVAEVLVVDTDMLSVSVHAFCHSTRSHPNTADTDVVIMGDASVELEADALNSGASVYLSLPLNERLVYARLMVVRSHRERLSVLNQMSHVDGLTQVGNRRRFDESFDAEWKWASRHNLWLGVLLIDADYFKRFNDEYGHLEGDRCLVMIAKALKDCTLRAHDLLARYGGEEFVAIVPAANQEGLAIVAERMMRVIRELNIPHQRSDIADMVTVSIGGACCQPGREQNRRDLLLAADEALYDVKHDGRNGCRIRCI